MENLNFQPLSLTTLAPCAAIAAHAPDPWSENDLATALEQPHQFCYVALLEDTPVGFASFFQMKETADLRQIVISPAHRGQGIGQQLLTHCMQILAGNGVTQLLLELRVSNTHAMLLYKKMGFRLLSRRRGMYTAPTEDGYLMGLLLAKIE